MINTFFIGDWHLGHKNIIGYNRPEFDNIDEMHEVMIQRHNAIVKPKDNVYHLGDVCFGKHNLHIVDRFNGNKKLILGNHDHYPIKEYLHYFDRVFGVSEYKGCILTHIPVHPQQFYRFKLNIHGHVHHKDPILTASDKYFNVCADHTNLTPVHWDVIKEKIDA